VSTDVLSYGCDDYSSAEIDLFVVDLDCAKAAPYVKVMMKVMVMVMVVYQSVR
jgi:hypothetical protein